MKKIASRYVDKDSREDIVNVELNVDELDEEQEIMVHQAVEELMRYVLRLKGITEACGGCTGC